MNVSDISLPVAVLGAGPVGLAAAAHLIERGLLWRSGAGYERRLLRAGRRCQSAGTGRLRLQ